MFKNLLHDFILKNHAVDCKLGNLNFMIDSCKIVVMNRLENKWGKDPSEERFQCIHENCSQAPSLKGV